MAFNNDSISILRSGVVHAKAGTKRLYDDDDDDDATAVPDNDLISLAVRAPAKPLAITVTAPQACSNMTVSWDVGKGKAPWTVVVAPLHHAHDSYQLTSTYLPASAKKWAWAWPVPQYAAGAAQQLLVAVSDSTGKVAGVSSLQTLLNAPTGTVCAGPNEPNLDFVWYPSAKSKAAARTPRECGEWPLAFQADPGNNGIRGAVRATFLPEKGIPETVSSVINGRSIAYNVQYEEGTKFSVYMTDSGPSKTGGVGDMYTVGAVQGKRLRRCPAKNVRTAAGLPDGTRTVTAASDAIRQAVLSGTIPSSTAASSSTGNGLSLLPTASGGDAPQASSSSAASSAENESHAGAAAGGAIGSIAGVALLGFLLFWCLKRRRSQSDEKAKPGRFSNQFVSPWRWSVQNGGAGGAAGKKGWSGMFRRSGMAREDDGNGNTGDMAQLVPAYGQSTASLAHSRGYSQSSSTGLHQRNVSLSQSNQHALDHGPASFSPSFGLGALSAGASQGDSAEASGATPRSQHAKTRSILSTVPDAALFPPPPPRTVPDDQLFPPPSPQGGNASLAPGQHVDSQDGYEEYGYGAAATGGAAGVAGLGAMVAHNGGQHDRYDDEGGEQHLQYVDDRQRANERRFQEQEHQYQRSLQAHQAQQMQQHTGTFSQHNGGNSIPRVAPGDRYGPASPTGPTAGGGSNPKPQPARRAEPAERINPWDARNYVNNGAPSIKSFNSANSGNFNAPSTANVAPPMPPAAAAYGYGSSGANTRESNRRSAGVLERTLQQVRGANYNPPPSSSANRRVSGMHDDDDGSLYGDAEGSVINFDGSGTGRRSSRYDRQSSLPPIPAGSAAMQKSRTYDSAWSGGSGDGSGNDQYAGRSNGPGYGAGHLDVKPYDESRRSGVDSYLAASNVNDDWDEPNNRDSHVSVLPWASGGPNAHAQGNRHDHYDDY